jgi:predicted membrane protein (TIGR00267 family)
VDKEEDNPVSGLFKRIASLIKGYRESLRIVGAGEIARRYFVMNAFDGALTVLGIVLGAYIAGVRDEGIVVSAVLGASLAMGLSGVWGAYMAEKAERTRKLKELETALFTNLKNTRLHRASMTVIVWLAVVDGGSPVMVALAAITPFFLSRLGVFSFTLSVYLSIFVSLATLFALGVFLGRISRENMVFQGLKMASAGVIIATILLILKATV